MKNRPHGSHSELSMLFSVFKKHKEKKNSPWAIIKSFMVVPGLLVMVVELLLIFFVRFLWLSWLLVLLC